MSCYQTDAGEPCPQCGETESWDHADVCPFVACDSPDCRALKCPVTLQEWITACDHWERHHAMRGCSHGR